MTKIYLSESFLLLSNEIYLPVLLEFFKTISKTCVDVCATMRHSLQFVNGKFKCERMCLQRAKRQSIKHRASAPSRGMGPGVVQTTPATCPTADVPRRALR